MGRILQETNVGDAVQVPASTTVVTLAAADPGRQGMTICNDSTALLHIKMGAAASLTSKTAIIAANGGYFEVPFGYRGIITGLWAALNGNAYVTKYS